MTKQPDIMSVASGKWPSLLVTLGFDQTVISQKHCPCPMCEGKDRFRMIDLEGGCRWICNQCGTGDAMDLIQNVMGWTFKAAVEKIRPLVPGATYSVTPKKPDQADIKRRTAELMDVWRGADNRAGVSQYLQSRGLPSEAFNQADLRCGKIKRFDADGKHLDDEQAMLARVITPQNRCVALHRTYLLPENKREKKITKTIGTINGGAIRLFNVKGATTLIIAEGIETAIAARWLLKDKQGLFPAWAAISANGMKKIAVPTFIERVIIMADNDSSYTGQAAAYDLANRLKVREKRNVEVFFPKKPDTDWLDYWNENHG
jgi:putative DNA primase/helicase